MSMNPEHPGPLLVRPTALQQRAPDDETPLVRRALDAQAALYVLEQGFFMRYVDPGSGLEVSKGISEQAVRAALGGVPVDSGWLPPNTVRWGHAGGGPGGAGGASGGACGDYCALFQPARRVTLHFENAPLFRALPGWAAHNRTVALSVPLPSLFFVAVGAACFAFAARAARFAPTLALYAPPLPNLDEEMRVCFGANVLPPLEAGGFGAAWRAFCEAPFSAHLTQRRSRAHPRDVRLALLAAAGRRAYPLADLVAIQSATPETVLARLIGRRLPWE